MGTHSLKFLHKTHTVHIFGQQGISSQATPSHFRDEISKFIQRLHAKKLKQMNKTKLKGICFIPKK